MTYFQIFEAVNFGTAFNQSHNGLSKIQINMSNFTQIKRNIYKSMIDINTIQTILDQILYDPFKVPISVVFIRLKTCLVSLYIT